MKYLVATNEKQGTRKNDFCNSEIDHFAMPGTKCDRATPDDNCGCARSMITPSNSKATTTVKVVERSEAWGENARAEVRNFFVGWKFFNDKQIDEYTDFEMVENQRVANLFPTGTVLEIRGNKIRSRH